MSGSSVIHPDFQPMPYWWEAAPPDDAGNLAPPGEVDVLVVGGGYTGLNAALELARAGRSVVVCEADRFGFGASSRNGGGVSAGISLGKGMSGGHGEQFGSAKGRLLLDRLMGESRLAFDLVGDLVAREGIQCHYEVSGRMVGAYTPGHFKKFSSRAETINRLTQADAFVLPKARIREEMASDFYHGGLVIGCAAKLHPALYMHGLRLAAAGAGATLCAHTQVNKIDGGPGQFTVQTSKGSVRCGEVVIGTNGYTGALTPSLRRGIVPATSHVIATEELPEDLVRGLIPKGRTLSESPRILHYYRTSPDGRRVIFGGRARFTDVDPKTRAILLHRAMVERFPQLADVRVTHSWTGYVAFTYDDLPHIGQYQGMNYALGCNGSGVAMMSYLGNLIARRILDNDAVNSAYIGLDLPNIPVPGYTGEPWFLPVVGGWYRLRDRIDRIHGQSWFGK